MMNGDDVEADGEEDEQTVTLTRANDTMKLIFIAHYCPSCEGRRRAS